MLKVIILFLISVSSFAQCLVDQNKLGQDRVQLTFFLKLYDIAYYQEGDEEIMRLHYLKNIRKEHSNIGWERGFKSNFNDSELAKYKSSLDWLYAQTPPVEKGDCLKIKANKNSGTFSISKNGKQIAQTSDKSLSKIIFYPWVGPKPLDDEVKSNLIGKK
ncbi:MAG: hypothetical protein GY909_18685 [Oligoflexia bacterium]|nr:hypothetical protein [Oligoflexia bacterium]